MGFNPLNAELNPICPLLVLLGAHLILHISRIRVNFAFEGLKPHTFFFCCLLDRNICRSRVVDENKTRFVSSAIFPQCNCFEIIREAPELLVCLYSLS